MVEDAEGWFARGSLSQFRSGAALFVAKLVPRRAVLGVKVCGWAVWEGVPMDLPSGTGGGHGLVTNDDGPVRMTPDEVTAKRTVTSENAD